MALHKFIEDNGFLKVLDQAIKNDSGQTKEGILIITIITIFSHHHLVALLTLWRKSLRKHQDELVTLSDTPDDVRSFAKTVETGIKIVKKGMSVFNMIMLPW